MYYDTTADALKIWAGGAWVEVGATSGVETFTNSSGTYVAFGTNNTNAIGDVTVGTVDLTAVDGTSTAADRFLTKNNKWATIPFGDITDVNGGTYITTANSAGPVVTVNHDLTTRTDTTSGGVTWLWCFFYSCRQCNHKLNWSRNCFKLKDCYPSSG